MASKIVYVCSEDLISNCDKLPTMLNRASMVQDLINAYGVLNPNKVLIISKCSATEDELKTFHSSSYIDFLKKVNDCNDSIEFENEQLEFGLGYDCPLLAKNFDFVKVVGGSSLTAAKLLNTEKFKFAINWFGGWHHAQRDAAEGFCYVNDIVIAIQKLTERFTRILYIDLDIHHGNGVQNAFEFSKKILTLSFHKHSPGFYPGTGSIDDIGTAKGKYHAINVPFLDGLSHDTFRRVFTLVFSRVVEAFSPEVLVVQCGADGLNGDPVGECNLTLETFGDSIKDIVSCNLPTLFLGGGGYNFPNAARLWAFLTSIIVGEQISEDIPETSEFFTAYGPTYELKIDAGNQKDYNTQSYIDNLISKLLDNCKNINSE